MMQSEDFGFELPLPKPFGLPSVKEALRTPTRPQPRPQRNLIRNRVISSSGSAVPLNLDADPRTS